jgi:hypothetical protein
MGESRQTGLADSLASQIRNKAAGNGSDDVVGQKGTQKPTGDTPDPHGRIDQSHVVISGVESGRCFAKLLNVVNQSSKSGSPRERQKVRHKGETPALEWAPRPVTLGDQSDPVEVPHLVGKPRQRGMNVLLLAYAGANPDSDPGIAPGPGVLTESSAAGDRVNSMVDAINGAMGQPAQAEHLGGVKIVDRIYQETTGGKRGMRAVDQRVAAAMASRGLTEHVPGRTLGHD